MELVIISTGEESTGLLNDFKTPGFSITMSGVDKGLIGTVHHDGNDSTIIVTKNNLSIKNINGRSEVLNLAINLSNKFKLTSLSRMDCDFEIFTSRDQVVLSANDGGAITLMSFEDETEFSSLIPAMNGTVGTSRVGKTIFIESTAVEFGLWVFLTESTVFEKFFGGICWVPELKRSRGNSNKS